MLMAADTGPAAAERGLSSSCRGCLLGEGVQTPHERGQLGLRGVDLPVKRFMW